MSDALFVIPLPRRIRLTNPLRSGVSECVTCAGFCYFLGSLSGFVSVATTIAAIAETPSNGGYALTTLFLGLSYSLKLAYYVDKKLALINGILASVGRASSRTRSSRTPKS